MNLKYIRNFFIIFIIALMFYASYIIIFNDMTLKNETVSKALIIGQNEKITTFKIGISEFDTFNPILTKNRDVQYISKLVYDSLFTISEDYKIQNCLATEINKISEKSYIIKIRKSVYWSNGEELSAEDIIYTIEKIKSEESIYTELVRTIESMELIDKYTMKINLNEQIPFFEYNLIFPIIKANIVTEEIYNIGMYNIKEKSENKIVLSKNVDWWNDDNSQNGFENIVINLYSDKLEEYKAFKKSKIDIINTNNINYEEYLGKYGYNAKDYICPKHTFLALNMENEYLSNLIIRQAINYAIDKQVIVNKVFNKKYVISNHPLDYGNYLYNDEYEHIYNPQEAGMLLNGQFENETISLRMIVKNTDDNKIKTAELIKADLENIGIIINIIQLDEKKYEECLNNKDYDLLLCTIDLSLSPDISFFMGEDNIFNYYNTDTQRVIYEISNITDEELLKQKYKEIIKYYLEEIPCISLYNNTNTLIYSENLRANVKPNYFNLFYGIQKWYSVKPKDYLG